MITDHNRTGMQTSDAPETKQKRRLNRADDPNLGRRSGPVVIRLGHRRLSDDRSVRPQKRGEGRRKRREVLLAIERAVAREGAVERIRAEYELDRKVRDLLERGGEDFGYRLVVRPPRPDFIVNFFPDTPRVSRGSYAVVNVEVQRQSGFAGAVEARLEDLPPGVTAEPLLVPPVGRWKLRSQRPMIAGRGAFCTVAYSARAVSRAQARNNMAG